ncbi:hypothetical protein A9Q91_05245 [Candidatus Gracilibacteria bacterium 28_42_T64]|nr:hypothetical protein A9Q91_05245 [Candidatus Gracilibacteria bacterium 28_42_T64]
MRKLLGVVLLLLSLGSYNLSYANWYGNTAVIYTDPGTTICPQGDPTCTICPDDGDITGGTPPGYDNDISVTDSSGSLLPTPSFNTDLLNSGTTNAILVGSGSGTMHCLKWDGSNPLIGYSVGGAVSTTDTWAKGNVMVTVTCFDAGGSLCDFSSYQYRESVVPFTCDSGGTWVTDYRKIYNTEGVRYICFRGKDIAGNGYIYSGIAIVKIDKTAPTASDIGNTTPIDNSDLLATNSQNISVVVSEQGGSPIVKIQGFFEDYSSATGDYLSTIDFSNTGSLIFSHSTENVDLMRLSSGGREYGFKVTYIEDEAGNKIGIENGSSSVTALKTFTYNVYANTILSTSNATNQLSNSANVADGSSKNLIITLEDIYGNEIIPASGIGRTIDLNFDVINNLRRNQYTQTQDAVYLNIPSNTSYSNRLSTGNTSFNTQPSLDGSYPFDFKVYGPTYDIAATNGKEFADPFSSFSISSITYDINGTLGNIGAQLIGSSNVVFSFQPLYKTQITGDLLEYGFVEGAGQTSQTELIRNASVVTPALRNIYLEFGSGSRVISNLIDLSVSGVAGNIVEGNQGNISNTSLFENSFGITSYDLDTLLTQSGGLLDDIQNTYLSTHISYNITAPNGIGTIPVVYNSDIIGKSNYWGGVGTDNTIQTGIKIYGNIHSENYNQIVSNQDIQIVGKNTKSLLKRDLRKKVFEVIKNVPHSGDGSQRDLMNNTVEYYKFSGLDAGENKVINLGDYNVLSENKTLVIYGGNVYITGNITPSSHLLGIIILKDSEGNGGNIYVDPSVTEINAIMYADKSLLSYNTLICASGEISSSCGGTQDILKDQLYILGTLFTENTIGASRTTPPGCPYYFNGVCDLEAAQKYDLNYLRRYFIYDSNLDGSITSADLSAKGGTSVFVNTDEEYFYPVVIKYNQKIQLTPPPLFD